MLQNDALRVFPQRSAPAPALRRQIVSHPTCRNIVLNIAGTVFAMYFTSHRSGCA
jgi:hypothetical protein